MRKILLLIAVLSLSACGEYQRVLKSSDSEYKYSFAKKYFNAGKFSRASALLEELYTFFKGTAYAEESLYLLAQSYYGMKDYPMASHYFGIYYNTYPNGDFTDLARYFSAYGLYLDSADPRLDQSQTYKAMEQLQLYMEYYPQSEHAATVQNLLFELQEKLAYKELLAARLYYNLGTYMGNNYLSCVITAHNALKNYPYSQYREEFLFYTLRAKYELALVSVDELLQERYRDVIDEYYNYTHEFPQGKYTKQALRYHDHIARHIVRNY